ncbi:MAG TPA: hypothetical protein VF011_06235 [Terriglobales bacterium]
MRIGIVSAVSSTPTPDREKELVDRGEEGRAWSTRDRYESYLSHWIEPRWRDANLHDIKTPMVEEWLSKLQRQAKKHHELGFLK